MKGRKDEALFSALWKWNNNQEGWQGVNCQSWWSLLIQSYGSQGGRVNQEAWEQQESSGTLWLGWAGGRNFRSSWITQRDSLGTLKTARFMLLILTLVRKWNGQIGVHLPFSPPQLSVSGAQYVAFVCFLSIRLSCYPYTPFWSPSFFLFFPPAFPVTHPPVCYDFINKKM